jgi:ABC-2 type transport system permease protein
LLGAALVQLPAVWVLPSIAVAAFGLVPRWTPLAWAAVAFFALLGQLGPMLKLSSWVLDVSPFRHIPQLPGGTFAATPLIWLMAVSGSLVLAGLIGIRRRDIG